MDLFSYLNNYKEEMPTWLFNYDGYKLNFQDVMSGRTAYYPGCGDDGSLITLCSASHCCHSIIYVDYWVTPLNFLKQIETIRTYKIIGLHEWEDSDIYPINRYHFDFGNKSKEEVFGSYKFNYNPKYFTVILERKGNKDETWGVKRFALTFLYADGIESYYQLYIMNYKTSPFIFLLEDYGLGGNYDKFGAGGLLDSIMKEYDNHPLFAMIGHSFAWDNYIKINQLLPIKGGMHNYERYLYAYPKGFEGVKYMS